MTTCKLDFSRHTLLMMYVRRLVGTMYTNAKAPCQIWEHYHSYFPMWGDWICCDGHFLDVAPYLQREPVFLSYCLSNTRNSSNLCSLVKLHCLMWLACSSFLEFSAISTPSWTLTYNGVQPTSKRLAILCLMVAVELLTTTAYHAQRGQKFERYSLAGVKRLQTFVAKSQKD